MDKQSKTIIKEVIQGLLEIRNVEINRKATIIEDFICYQPHKGTTDEDVENARELTISMEIQLVKLNNLLEVKDKVEEVLTIEENMKKIQVKDYISVKEFRDIFGYSPEWQKNRRSRIHNTLPYIQIVEGGKITYDIKKVKNWFNNENITI